MQEVVKAAFLHQLGDNGTGGHRKTHQHHQVRMR